jgi:hypothetical protein
MKKHKNRPESFTKVWFVDFFLVRFLLLFPVLVIITLWLFQDTYKLLHAPILLTLILIYYISLIPIAILLNHYRDKRESRKRIEQRDMEEKVFLKYLRK